MSLLSSNAYIGYFANKASRFRQVLIFGHETSTYRGVSQCDTNNHLIVGFMQKLALCMAQCRDAHCEAADRSATHIVKLLTGVQHTYAPVQLLWSPNDCTWWDDDVTCTRSIQKQFNCLFQSIEVTWKWNLIQFNSKAYL